jgi:hypothetical protein
MADNKLLSQMLEHLVNDDQAKAEELFHEYVVSASREIYENLIESELEDDEEDDEEVDEAAEKDEDEEDEKVEENFEDIAYEGEEEEHGFGGDATDDLAGELDAGDEMDGEEKSEEELFQDLDAIVDELQAKFDELKGGDHAEPDADNMGGPSDHDADNEEESMEGFDELETVREYVEKVGNPKHGDNGANAKSIVAGKNDMGGTTANILGSKEEAPKYAGAGGGQLGGSSLFKGTAKEENFGNVNVPGGNAGKTAFKKKEPGHGAEKKGEAEGKFSAAGGSAGSVDKASLFRGRR